jgi:hypothetical protein
VSNIITIEFLNKKDFPPGKWLNEPDLCFWYHHEMPCLALRDMSMGIWKGFVGVSEEHSLFEQPIEHLVALPQALELFQCAHGGISGVGRLSAKHQNFAKECWWIGIETSQGGDLMPLLKLDKGDPIIEKFMSNQTYKDLHFIRRETNKLARYLIKIK